MNVILVLNKCFSKAVELAHSDLLLSEKQVLHRFPRFKDKEVLLHYWCNASSLKSTDGINIAVYCRGTLVVWHSLD